MLARRAICLLLLIAACGVEAETESVLFAEGKILERDLEPDTPLDPPSILVGPGPVATCGFRARLHESTSIRVLWPDGSTEPGLAEQLEVGVYVRVFIAPDSIIEDSCPQGVGAGIVEIVPDRSRG